MTSAWLIERVDGTAWLGRARGFYDFGWCWTTANDAIRFVRETDACNAASALNIPQTFRVTEHEWPEDKPVVAYVPPSRDDEPKSGDPKWASWLFDRVFNHGVVAITVDDWRRLMHTVENLEAAATANALAPNELLEQTRARCDYLEAKMDRQRSEIAKLLAAKESLRNELRRSKSNKATDLDPIDVAMSQVTEDDILEGEQQVRDGQTIVFADLRDEVSVAQQETAWHTDREELREKQSFDFLYKEPALYDGDASSLPDFADAVKEYAKGVKAWKGPWAQVFGDNRDNLHCYTQDKQSLTVVINIGENRSFNLLVSREDGNPAVGFTGDPQDIADALHMLWQTVEALHGLVVEADKMVDFWLRLFSAQPHRRMVHIDFGTQVVNPLVNALRTAKDVLS